MINLKRKSFVITTGLACLLMGSVVFADSNLSDIKIQGKTSDGEVKEVYLTKDFDGEGDEIYAVAAESTAELVIDATPTDENANVSYDWTTMDPGDNTSHVYVKGSDGTSKTYTIYTTVDDDSYNQYATSDEDGDSDLEVILKSGSYYVQKSLKGIKLPEGYKRKRIKYNGVKVWSGYSDVKNTTILYLINENGKGKFFIYDKDKDQFKVLREIKVKSRLYTVVYPEKTDENLRQYKKETIKIGSNKVRVWVRDEAEGLYLIYLMNWDGEINLYQFDTKENVFQRFIVNASQEAALAVADKTIDDLNEKNQDLVKKYNKDNSLKWKVIIGLITGLVILVFIILNLMLKIASQKRKLVDAEERALRATSKRSKYLVEKPGIKTVVPNQKIDKKPKNDVDIKSVTSTGYDDMQIDLTDSVKEEFEKGAAIKDNFKDGKKEDTKVNKMPQAKEADNKKSEVSGDKKPENKVTPVKAAESKPVVAKAAESESTPAKVAESKPTPAKEEDDFDDDGFEFIMIDDE